MKNNKEWYKANVLASNSMKKSEKQNIDSSKYKKIQNKIIAQRIDMAIIIAIVLMILIFLIFVYKPNSIDFLKEIKSTYTYGMIIILGVLTISIILFNIIIKEKKILSNLLKIVLFFNITFLIIFLCIEAILNKTYNNEECFGEFYDTKIENKTDEEQIDLWKSLITLDMQTKTEREVFIDENISQYRYFRIRVYLILILYVITMMANTYMISKIEKEIKGQEILKKDDKIIFKNQSE